MSRPRWPSTRADDNLGSSQICVGKIDGFGADSNDQWHRSNAEARASRRRWKFAPIREVPLARSVWKGVGRSLPNCVRPSSASSVSSVVRSVFQHGARWWLTPTGSKITPPGFATIRVPDDERWKAAITADVARHASREAHNARQHAAPMLARSPHAPHPPSRSFHRNPTTGHFYRPNVGARG